MFEIGDKVKIVPKWRDNLEDETIYEFLNGTLIEDSLLPPTCTTISFLSGQASWFAKV